MSLESQGAVGEQAFFATFLANGLASSVYETTGLPLIFTVIVCLGQLNGIRTTGYRVRRLVHVFDIDQAAGLAGIFFETRC